MRATNLSKTLNSRSLFHSVSFTIEKGSLVVIRGTSGSGKSTLLRCIANLDQLDEGSYIDLFDIPMHLYSGQEWRKRVIYVSQKVPKLPGTPYDTIRDLSQMRNSTEDELFDSISEICEQLKISANLLNDQWATVSGGEGQRIMHAIVMSMGGNVLLLDEPTASLDAESTRRLEMVVQSKRKEGIIVFWVTHDEEQSKRLCPNLILNFDE